MDDMSELKPCPFCGGTGKVSFKDYEFGGQNGFGDKKIKYRTQVICNRCRSRGKPIITDWLINPNPYLSKWGNCGDGTSPRGLKQTSMFKPYVEQAIKAWNRRAGEDVLISKQAAIDALGDEPEARRDDYGYALGFNNQWHYDVNALKALSSAQPEIVRCKDCKFGNISSMGHLAVCGHEKGLVDPVPDSYCSYAERRTDEQI